MGSGARPAPSEHRVREPALQGIGPATFGGDRRMVLYWALAYAWGTAECREGEVGLPRLPLVRNARTHSVGRAPDRIQ